MSSSSTAILVTVLGIVIIASVTALLWQRRKSPRQLLIGTGAALIVLGLYLTGVLHLTLNGIASLRAWIARTPLDSMMWFGIGIITVAVILIVLGCVIKGGPAGGAVKSAGGANEGAKSSRSGKQVTKAGAAEGADSTQVPVDTDESYDDIEEILKRRGIQ